MMLGPCSGGVVHLAVPGDVLMVGEGIETEHRRHAGDRYRHGRRYRLPNFAVSVFLTICVT